MSERAFQASKPGAGLRDRRHERLAAERDLPETATALLELQRTAGNTATHALISPSGGHPLPPSLRADMERRFGYDFAGLRVHTDAAAARGADALAAKAYTVGSDVVFNAGRYQPETTSGRWLIAHELAHVIQQTRGGPAPAFDRASSGEQAARAAADQAAAGATSGGAEISVGGGSSVGVAREEDDKKKPDPEVTAALDMVNALDLQKPSGLANAPETGAPKPAPLDPELLAASRSLRQRTDEWVAKRDEAVAKGQPPPPRPKKTAADRRYTKKVNEVRRAETAASTERIVDVIKNADKAPPVSEEGATDPKYIDDLHRSVVSARAFANSLGVGLEQERAGKELASVRASLASVPNLDEKVAAFNALKAERQAIQDSKDKSPAATAKLADLDTKIGALKPVNDAASRAASLERQLAISSFADPSDPAATSKGAEAGRGQNTYVVIQIVDKDGNIVASTLAENGGKRPAADVTKDNGPYFHAEENALPELDRQLGGKAVPGGRMVVVGDQVVCTDVCKPAIKTYAEKLELERADGYTIHNKQPGQADEEARSAKTTAQRATLAEPKESGRVPRDQEEAVRRHEPVYRRQAGGTEGEGPGSKGGGSTALESEGAAPVSKGSVTLDENASPSKTVSPQADETVAGVKVPANPAIDESSATATKSSSPILDIEGQPVTPVKTGASTLEGEAAQKTKTGTTPAPVVDAEGQQKTATNQAATPEVETQTGSKQPSTPPTGGGEENAKSQPNQPQAETATPEHRVGQVNTALSALLEAKVRHAQLVDQGVDSTEAWREAGGRALLTLGANLKGGAPANLVNAYNSFERNLESGQKPLEAAFTAFGTVGGGFIANKVAKPSIAGLLVEGANTVAQLVGAPEEVQLTTAGAAELVPSQIVSRTISAGARSWWNVVDAIATGDTSGVDRTAKDFNKGEAGPWIQGYSQWTGIAADVASGKSFQKALDDAAASGKGSWADKTGSKLGSAFYDLGQSETAKKGDYGMVAQGWAQISSIGSDLVVGKSFDKAIERAAAAGKGSTADKIGSALGDVAWTATEKTTEFINEDLPAAKAVVAQKASEWKADAGNAYEAAKRKLASAFTW